ncbi:FG-GAP repeat protein [Streptomyces sp. NPDC048560]|uniref:FG-GAP repeat protein n=1 Tax=Streptomyces sp. NPDC048560 TaxID=3155488 RepID=UPI00342432FD
MATRAIGTTAALAVAVAAAAVITAPAAQATAPARATASAAASPAVSATAAGRVDYNGDGFADLAVAAPGATVNGRAGAGYVGVVYGSTNGPATATRQILTQDSAGVPDAAEAGDAFGSALASADLDRDGYSDLVVGAATEKNGTVDRTGLLTVIWGGATGLSGGATLLTGEQYDGVGRLLTAGDFDGDGFADLATVRWADLQTLSGPFTRAGAAASTAAYPDVDDRRYLDLGSGDVNGDGRDDVAALTHAGDEFDSRRIVVAAGGATGLGALTAVRGGPDGYAIEGGEHLAVGRVNGDAYADLVVGRAIDGYDSDMDLPLARGGMVTYVPGGATGAQGTKAKVFNQDSAGIPGAAELSDGFGSSVAIGDTNGDGLGEIAVGVSGEALGTVARAGAVIVMAGTSGGPTATGAKGFNQDTAGVAGVAEPNDRFAAAAAFTDGDKDGRAELAVGAPGEDTGAGALWFLPATTTGTTATGSSAINNATLGTVAVKAALGASFGR